MSGSAEGINFDLSEYKDHGELSEGLIWVIKETSDWDTDPYESYAYLDCNGNVIYGWHYVGEYFYNEMAGFSGYRRARLPQNFKNGFALIYNASGVDNLGGYVDATVIDKSGSEVAHFLIDAYISRGELHMDYEDFNNQGYAFFIGKETYDSEKGMFFVNDSGVHMFQCNENSYISGYTLETIDVINDKYFYAPESNNQLFNLHGNLVLDISESAGIHPDKIEIINDSYIAAYFTGKDDKDYVCVIDFDGNFIKSPVLKSEYIRDLEKTGQNDINSSKPLDTSTGGDHAANKNTGNAVVVKPASALEVLEKAWAAVCEEDKFHAMGGDFGENLVDGAPGACSLIDEWLSTTLLVPGEQLASIDEAASLVHGMMPNNFTCGVFRIAGDPTDFADAMYNAISTNRWMCGMPEQLIVAVIGGEYVLACFGINDAIGPFEAAFIATYPTAEIKYSEGIKG